MDEETLNSRLSRIATAWTVLIKAHQGPDAEARDARLLLIQRYQRAAYRYLLGSLRDADAADDLFQEFALRVMQGAFRRADPKRGRFRDYLKTALVHLIVDHQKSKRRGPVELDLSLAQPAAPECDPAEADRQFQESWREELLARTWEGLADMERQTGQPYYRVLRYRVEHPDASSGEMAAQLTDALRSPRPFTEAGVRKRLQRAREQFAALLIDDVAHSLDRPTPEELQRELIDLDLLSYCRSAFARRYGRS